MGQRPHWPSRMEASLIPLASTKYNFLCVKWKSIFSHITQKISFKITILYWNSYSRKCTYFWCTYFDFFCFFHHSFFPSVTYLFLPKVRKKSSTLKAKLHKMYFRGQSQSVENENTHHPSLNFFAEIVQRLKLHGPIFQNLV